MIVRGQTTTFSDVKIDPSEVLENLRKEYIRTLNIDSADGYIREDNVWVVEEDFGSHSHLTIVRKATLEEIEIMRAFTLIEDIARKSKSHV